MGSQIVKVMCLSSEVYVGVMADVTMKPQKR